MQPSAERVDVLVIGSGPAGQRAAVEAAHAGRGVVIVDRREVVGGVCVHSGTIPSKTLREAVLYLTGFHHRSVYGESWAVKHDISMEDLTRHAHHVMQREIEAIEASFTRAGVRVIHGVATFVAPDTVEVCGRVERRAIRADRIVIAVGTRPARPETVCFRDQRIIDSDEILTLATLPRSLVVVGGGVVGLEYATMFATLGAQVTVIDGRKRLLEFVDDEIVEALQYRFRAQGGLLRLGEKVESVACPLDSREPIRATLESGKTVAGDCLLFAAGRIGAVEDLGLDAVGLPTDERGRIAVDAEYRTALPHVYAAGDVIGFPALASTSAEQGRCAARFALGLPATPPRGTFPYGIYTVPEISMVGRTEAELTAARVPYEVGVARWRDVARAVITGDTTGMLKCLFGEDRRLLGVHVIGRGATEIVHIGQAVMDHGGGLDYLVEAVFNYPTLAEAFKLAALDALERLERRGR